MKKFFLTIVSVNLLFLPLLIGAQGQPPPPADQIEEAPTVDILGEDGVLAKIRDYLFTILLIVAAIFIIIAAYFFVTAAGDPEKTGKARNFVLYALIGVLVGFAAKGLVLLIGQIVGWEVAPF